MAKSSKINTAVLATIAAIGAGWAAWLLYWPFGLAVYVPLLAMASSRGTKPAIACAALSPFMLIPAVFFGLGAQAYLQGKAVIMVRGEPTVESTNLDPRHRVRLIHAPRAVDARHGFGWFAYEGGVRLMGSLAGPMHGSYAGPYPSRVQAWRHLDAAADAFVDRGQFNLGTQWLPLPLAIREVLADERRDPHAVRPPLRAHRVGETLLIGRPDQVWLLRESTGEIFATWRRAPDVPRTQWPAKSTTPPSPPAPAVADGGRPYASPAY